MNIDGNKEYREKVLVVDDSAENLRVLSSILAKDYSVSISNSAGRALEILKEFDDFDIILLDIMMPEMDGINLCKLIKSQHKFADVPIIFISGLTDIKDKRLAFEAGGVDYIVKPFEKEEVLLRVGTHLRIRRLQKELLSKNKELEINYQELKKLEDLKNNLFDMIVHDLRSPLTGVLSVFEILKMECEGLNNEELLRYIKSGYNAATSLLEMINSLLDISRLEEGKFPLKIGTYSIKSLIDDAIMSIAASINKTDILVEARDNIYARCDYDVIKRVLVNLITNSLKHSGSKGPIRVLLEKEEKEIVVSVIDDGIGIPKEYHKKVFEKFGQVELRNEKKRYSIGLGLAFCKLAVEAHGGRIGLESEVGRGCRFYFTLPIKD